MKGKTIMLSFSEEIYLLALDDVTGAIYDSSDKLSISFSLIGAVLCELSFMGRIDTDEKLVYLISDKSTGNPTLDSVLDTISKGENKLPVSYWLKNLSAQSNKIENTVIEQLIDKGVLKKAEKKIFGIFTATTYPKKSNKKILEDRTRELVLTEDAVPTPREAVLISLIQACNLFPKILSKDEFKSSQARIINLSKLESIGRETTRMIEVIRNIAMEPNIIVSYYKGKE